MSVYLGTYGQVELRRASEAGEKQSVVDPADVNTTRRRFSFDFDAGFLNTGDQLEITTTDGSLLSFVAASGWLVNAVQNSGKWYINVDELGGIRLYTSYDAAIEGASATAVVLTTPAASVPIKVTIANSIPRILAQCSYFELNTNREVVDTTALGEEFRSQYSSLISGSGNFRAFWEYVSPNSSSTQSAEAAHYLLQLAVRTEVGSRFNGRFYLKTVGVGNSPSATDDSIWYEVDAVITQAGVSFNTDSAVEINADFVTTGKIKLLTQTQPRRKVLQENYDRVLLEQGTANALLQEEAD